jgi:hypothetical protein
MTNNLFVYRNGTDVGVGVTDRFLKSSVYSETNMPPALDERSTEQLAAGMNEILRVAYNFASDATTYLSLIVCRFMI